MASIGTIRFRNGSSWIDILHPIGSFYISNTSTSPASLFGGSWTQITNAALRGAAGTGYTGSDSTVLTVNQIPSHTHNIIALSPIFYQGSSNGRYVYVSDTNNEWTGRLTKTGGAVPTRTSNVHTIVTCGIAPRKQIRGEW